MPRTQNAVELGFFSWDRPKKGTRVGIIRAHRFTLLEGVSASKERFLSFEGEVTRHDPMKTWTGLFRTFAEVEPNEEGIKRFAARYGLLGQSARQAITTDAPRPTGGKVKIRPSVGESVAAWKHEILEMREAVELWEAIKESDLRALRKRVFWSAQGVRYRSARRGSWVGHVKTPKRLARFTRGDVIQPARQFLQDMVNEKLESLRVHPRLLSDQLGKLSLYHVPQCLLGAMWLQFANAISGRRYRRCEACELWYEIGSSARSSRSDKRFCTPTCKARAHWQKTHSNSATHLLPEPAKTGGDGKLREVTNAKRKSLD